MRQRLVHRHLDRTSAHNRASWGTHYLRAGFMLDGWELCEARQEMAGDQPQLLPTGAYCLWMEERADSLWHPSARLFRQSEPNDWRPVIARMAAELPRFIGTRA